MTPTLSSILAFDFLTAHQAPPMHELSLRQSFGSDTPESFNGSDKWEEKVLHKHQLSFSSLFCVFPGTSVTHRTLRPQSSGSLHTPARSEGSTTSEGTGSNTGLQSPGWLMAPFSGLALRSRGNCSACGFPLPFPESPSHSTVNPAVSLLGHCPPATSGFRMAGALLGSGREAQ